MLYMLYRYGGDQHSWFSSLSPGSTADNLFAHHAISPLIIVSPDYGNGIDSVPTHSANPGIDEGPYEDYLARDLVTYVDEHYPTIASRNGRYVGGASMGGYAAL